jgi:hypothetical protein
MASSRPPNKKFTADFEGTTQAGYSCILGAPASPSVLIVCDRPDDYDEDSRITQIGTALPQLKGGGSASEDMTGKVAKLPKEKRDKFAQLQSGVVTDALGRQRFHGAFTGGFSAGYFNSVDTREGWAPKQFVSSRSSKAAFTHRPEDYMGMVLDVGLAPLYFIVLLFLCLQMRKIVPNLPKRGKPWWPRLTSIRLALRKVN